MYKNTNRPILEELAKKVEVVYLTLDPKDDFLLNPLPNTIPLLVDLGVLGVLFLKNIRANLFITTTPGLGALALKKSKNVAHYSYIMHTATDIHRYARFSFDCFDSVVCCAEFQVKTLNHLEKTRNFPTKEKVVLGVPYYDIMVEEYQSSPCQTSNKTVLIAPSWGNSNFLNYYPNDIVGEFLDNGYNVILRPHPQSFKFEPRVINNIVDKHKNNPNFSLDKNISNIESMKKSTLLVSGYSGMIFDFIFLTEKPCILFDLAQMTKGFEEEDIDFPSWEEELMPKIGKLVSLDDSIDIHKILDEIDSNQTQILQNIRQAKNDIANFGMCASKIADYYINKLEK